MQITRRAWARMAGMALAAGAVRIARSAEISLFDGSTLHGWVQIENNATSLSGDSIIDVPALVDKMTKGTDAISEYLRSRLPDAVKAQLAQYSTSEASTKAAVSALVKSLNQVIDGPSIYTSDRFAGVPLGDEAEQLMQHNPTGQSLARLNKVLLEDAYPEALAPGSTQGWMVKGGAMASMGRGRGVIYTARDFSHYRLQFTMRHVAGMPDHQACVLIFCTRPKDGEKPLDALGGVQFQVPKGGHWDYRPGMNNAGGAEFTTVTKTQFDPHEWSRVEILADASKGTARMAVAQPVGSTAVEVLDFRNPAAGKVGPVAWQMHNAGLFDEYKDVTIEPDPSRDDLITVK